MTETHKLLLKRANSICEISGTSNNLEVYTIAPQTTENLENCILIEAHLKTQIENPATTVENDWRSLSESMWSEHLPVQVVSWRMLARLKNHDLLDQMYLSDEDLIWAKATNESEDENKIIHKDSNGVILQNGDSIVLIKDLDVKGANFTAKRGAAMHNIKLVFDNENQIEGRLENQSVVILTQYVKKTK